MAGADMNVICINVYVDGKREQENQPNKVYILGLKEVKHSVKLEITNKSKEIVQFVEYWHGYKGNVAKLTDSLGVGQGNSKPIKPGGVCSVTVALFSPKQIGMFINLNMRFLHKGRTFILKKNIDYDCVEEKRHSVFKLIKPITEEDDVDTNDELYEGLEIIGLRNPESHCQLEHSLELLDYSVQDWKKSLVCSPHYPEKDAEIREKMCVGDEVNFETYDECFGSLLDMEEIQMWRDISHYTIKSVRLYPNPNPDRMGNPRYRIRIPGLAEKRPSVVRGDRFYVSPVPPEGFKYEGQVDDTSQSDAYVVLSPQFEDDVENVDQMRFRVEFGVDRMSMRIMHRAVEMASVDENMESVLFPTSYSFQPLKDPATVQIDCFEKRLENNPEQLAAVHHIVAGTSRPAPYLIYGPPGTGKTFTLVEAVKQVCKMYRSSKILVCAPQNDAADLVAERLLDHVDAKSIGRFNAASRYANSMSDKIRDISFFSRDNPDNILFPCKEELMGKQIIVSTLVSAGRLVSAEMEDHFTHMFIDEAGHATEPETIIPLTLLNPNKKNGGQIVLAGDPQQLGAIIRSSMASKFHMGQSLLERLMNDKEGPYTRVESRPDGPYDQKYVTKLLQNFRSHPAILEVPNQLFYKFELIPSAPKEEIEKFCGWQNLPVFSLIRYQEDNVGFPLVFYRVDGREEQEVHSPSWYNRHEVMQVLEFVEKLLFDSNVPLSPKNIGIISPYLLQVKKIRQALRAVDEEKQQRLDGDISDIKVGSVERFQGDEREVIIISTVRSQTENLQADRKFNLGFVSNKKRFNVAATRAKSLLIVIGNPKVLCTDENWRRLLEHIIKGGGYEGTQLTEEELRIEPDQLHMEGLRINDDGDGDYHLHVDDTIERRN